MKVFYASTKEQATDEATIWVLKQGNAIRMTTPATTEHRPEKGWAVTVYFRYHDRST